MVEARPVDIVNSSPLAVEIKGETPSHDNDKQSQTHDPSLPAKTTFQEDITTAGQRKVNLIWEYTQSFVSVIIVISNMIVAVYQGLVPYTGLGQRTEFPFVLSSSLFLVVGFYFSRTNHAAIGGIGPKPYDPYVGR